MSSLLRSRITSYFGLLLSDLEVTYQRSCQTYARFNIEPHLGKKHESFKQKIDECKQTCLAKLNAQSEDNINKLLRLSENDLNKQLFPKFCFIINESVFQHPTNDRKAAPNVNDMLGYLIVIDDFLSNLQLKYYHVLANHFIREDCTYPTAKFKLDEKYLFECQSNDVNFRFKF
jgi:hypothetical protein